MRAFPSDPPFWFSDGGRGVTSTGVASVVPAPTGAHTLRDRILVAGGLVLCPEDRRGRRLDILVEGDAIAAMLPPGTAQPEDAALIDARNHLLVPGFVNAHTHGHGGLSKGIGDRWTLELLLNAGGWIGGARSDEDRYLSTLLTAVEMLKKGCTSAFDLALAMPLPSVSGIAATARAYLDAGMRAVVAPMIGDITFYRAVPGMIDAAPNALRREMEDVVASDGATLLTALERVAADWAFPSDRLRLAMAPTIPLHSSDAFLEGCHRIAREHGLILQTHLAESRAQAVAARTRYGCSVTAHLAARGIIDQRFSGAHGVWLDEDDMALLADRGAAVAHNPGSNLRLGSGIADITRLLELGVAVGIGTDGGASSDGQNMFEATRLACHLSRVQGRPPERWLSSDGALALATAGSARVLGMQDLIGRLAPGYKADIVFLDLGHINFVPLNDAANQLVHVEDATAVTKVMVGGRVVVENRRVLTVDEIDLARQAASAAERLRHATRDQRDLAVRLEPFVGRFCHGLACARWTDRAATRHSLEHTQ